MRELEFLPDWYPKARRRKRMLALQSYMTAILLAGVAFSMFLLRRNVSSEQSTLNVLLGQNKQSVAELKQLDDQVRLRAELTARKLVNAKLGAAIDMSRLLQLLDTLMPREMSITDMSVETRDEVAAVGSSANAARLTGANNAAGRGASGSNGLDRRVVVKLLTVAPTDVDLANFFTALRNVPFFQQVEWSFARERTNDNHVMREFEITFSVNLSLAGV